MVISGDVEQVLLINAYAEVYLTDAAVVSDRHPLSEEQY